MSQPADMAPQNPDSPTPSPAPAPTPAPQPTPDHPPAPSDSPTARLPQSEAGAPLDLSALVDLVGEQPSAGPAGVSPRRERRQRDAATALSGYAASLEGCAPRSCTPRLLADLQQLVELCWSQEWRCVRGLVLHTIAQLCATLAAAGVDHPTQEVADAVFDSLHGDSLEAAVHVASAMLLRHDGFADIACTPILGELLQALDPSADPEREHDLLRLLMLGNALLDAVAHPAQHIPLTVAQQLLTGLAQVRQGAARDEALLLSSRLQPLSNASGATEATRALNSLDVEKAKGLEGGGRAGEGGTVAEAVEPVERSYSETEVKSFLSQRKLEWEGQLRKRDKAINLMQPQLLEARAEGERVGAALKQAQTQLEESNAKADELEKRVAQVQKENVELENKLEETYIFLREREHQAVNLEEQLKRAEADLEKLQTESQVLGEANEQLAGTNGELESYVKELMDDVEGARQQQEQQAQAQQQVQLRQAQHAEQQLQGEREQHREEMRVVEQQAGQRQEQLRQEAEQLRQGHLQAQQALEGDNHRMQLELTRLQQRLAEAEAEAEQQRQEAAKQATRQQPDPDAAVHRTLPHDMPQALQGGGEGGEGEGGEPQPTPCEQVVQEEQAQEGEPLQPEGQTVEEEQQQAQADAGADAPLQVTHPGHADAPLQQPEQWGGCQAGVGEEQPPLEVAGGTPNGSDGEAEAEAEGRQQQQQQQQGEADADAEAGVLPADAHHHSHSMQEEEQVGAGGGFDHLQQQQQGQEEPRQAEGVEALSAAAGAAAAEVVEEEEVAVVQPGSVLGGEGHAAQEVERAEEGVAEGCRGVAVAVAEGGVCQEQQQQHVVHPAVHHGVFPGMSPPPVAPKAATPDTGRRIVHF